MDKELLAEMRYFHKAMVTGKKVPVVNTDITATEVRQKFLECEKLSDYDIALILDALDKAEATIKSIGKLLADTPDTESVIMAKDSLHFKLQAIIKENNE